MKIYDLLGVELVQQMHEQGYIRYREHPNLPLRIINYTEKCAYEGVWNQVTANCRGLIFNTDTLEIIARPFPKFMNYGQTGAAEIALDEAVSVTNKMDGSLGIIYHVRGNRRAVATRGSFESDQAIHATKVLRNKYYNCSIPAGLTYLVEIVYPANRIVLNYGDMDDLVLLGAVDIETGHIHGPGSSIPWPGPRTEVFDAETFAEALAIPPRPNAEGLVIRTGDDRMLKIKQEDYIALHRIVTNLSEKSIWEVAQKGDTVFQDFVASLPDEFHQWAGKVYCEFMNEFDKISNAAFDEYYNILQGFGLESWEDIEPGSRKMPRKDFALEAIRRDKMIRPYLFKIYDGQSFEDLLWQQLKPSGPVGVESRSEDVA